MPSYASYSAAVLTDAPLLYFRMDQASGSWVDSGSNGVSATRLAGAVAGGAATADGGTSYSPPINTNASLGTVSSMPALSGASTVEFWLFLPTGNQSGLFTHVGGANGWTTGVGNTAQWQAGRNLVLGMTNVGYTVTSYAFPNVGGWRHVVVSKDAGNNYIAYVNGTQVASGAFSSAIQTPTAGFNWGGDNGLPLPGQVYFDEVAVYSGQLSAAQVLTHYNARLSSVYASEVLADVPLAYYRLGEAAGATVMVDSSGNGRDGSYASSGVTLNQASLVTGDTNGAMLSATGNNTQVSYAAWQPQAKFTVECLIKTNSLTNYQMIAARHQPSAADFRWILNTDGSLELQVFNGSAFQTPVRTAAGVIAVNTRYHVVLTYDTTAGSVAIVYVNGVQVATGAMGRAIYQSPNLYVGNEYNGSAPFDGVLDEFAYYGTILSPTRVAAHYQVASGFLTGSGTLSATASPSVSRPVGQSGAGTLTVGVKSGFSGAVSPSGDGLLTAVGQMVVGYTDSAGLSGSGLLEASGFQLYAVQLFMQLSLTETALTQAPTAVVASVTDGWPGDTVAFSIDGSAPVLTTVLNTDGRLLLRSVDVAGTYGAGTHTLTVTSLDQQPGWSASATFTLALAPAAPAVVVPPDVATVATPGAVTGTGVRRWVFQDVVPGGLGSYVLPRNPRTMTSPEWRRTLSNEHSTSVDHGRYHFYEGNAPAVPWSFTGYLETQAEYLQFEAYAALERRIYVIDHRGRAWKVAITDFDARPRKRQHLDTGAFNDWAHDYTMNLLIVDRAWTEPVA